MSPSAFISLANGFILIALVLLSYFGMLELPLIFSYQMHKFLHIIGVMLFFGNMIVGPVWLILALQTKQIETIRYAARLLRVTDIWLTVVPVNFAMLNGLAMATALGGIKAQPWLVSSMWLLVVMWAMALPTVYFQEKMYHFINQGDVENKGFLRALIGWGIVGTVISIPAALVLYLMVFKSW